MFFPTPDSPAIFAAGLSREVCFAGGLVALAVPLRRLKVFESRGGAWLDSRTRQCSRTLEGGVFFESPVRILTFSGQQG
jgi:hypothetical protein